MTHTIDVNVCRVLAVMKHENLPFFFFDGIAYEGDEQEVKNAYELELSAKMESGEIQNEEDFDFLTYVSENCTEIEGLDAEDEIEGYYSLTDDEANEKAKAYILDSVWAFNAWFLASETGIDQEVFEAIQSNGRCESNNSAILRLIEDEDSFVESAIAADGRGHFLNTYDGNEYEVVLEPVEGYELEETYFFLYRS